MTCVAPLCECCKKREHKKEECYDNPDSPWYRPRAPQLPKPEPPKAPINAIIWDGTEPAQTWVTLWQEDQDLGVVTALLDSGAGAKVINTETALRMGLEPNYTGNGAMCRELTAINGQEIKVTGMATAVIECPNNDEYPVTVHMSPDIGEDTLIISCEVMIQMGILKLPAKRAEISKKEPKTEACRDEEEEA